MKQWMNYLQQAGACIENATVLHFGQPDQEQQRILHDTILVDLSYLGLIKVSGQDAEKFLQGQFTNDVRQVNVERCQLSAWCSHKGRVIATFYLFKRDQAYYLLLPQIMIDEVITRLSRYLLRADVQLEIASEIVPRFGIAGAQSTEIVAHCLNCTPPTTVDASVTTAKGVQITKMRGEQPRYLVVGEIEELKPLWENALANAHPVGSWAWQLLDIFAGIPAIVPPLVEVFVPQMLNLQTLEGVSFKKGCYTGQEVVARMQYLGNLKQRLYFVKSESRLIPASGTELYLDEQKTAVGGTIVNAQPHPQGGYVALAVIQVEYEGVTLYDIQGMQVV